MAEDERAGDAQNRPDLGASGLMSGAVVSATPTRRRLMS
jgi:hypothetical protein